MIFVEGDFREREEASRKAGLNRGINVFALTDGLARIALLDGLALLLRICQPEISLQWGMRIEFVDYGVDRAFGIKRDAFQT